MSGDATPRPPSRLGLLCRLAVEAVAGFDRPTVWPNLATAFAALAPASRPSVRDDGRGGAR